MHKDLWQQTRYSIISTSEQNVFLMNPLWIRKWRRYVTLQNCKFEICFLYVGAHIGTGPVLELAPIFHPMLELGHLHPHTGTHSPKLIWCQFGDNYWLR